jgi:cobalt-zinc-cadmium efflux system outer membrane protein
MGPPHAVKAGPVELGLREALEMALSQNKELAASGFRLVEQEGLIRQAGVRRNPELAVDLENMGGQGFFEGFDHAESTLTLGWAIEPGLRSRRVGVARARSARARLDVHVLQIDVAAETAQRFLSCLQSQAHLVTTEEAVALAERMVGAVERRVQAGRAANAELSRARAALATERLAQEDVSHERSVAYHRLAAQWGETRPSFSRVDGNLLDLPSVVSFEELLGRLDRNPELARLVSDERIADARLRLEKARRWPTLTPSFGVRHLGTTNDWALVAGLKVELPLFDRNQGQVAASSAALERTRADAGALRVRTRTRLFEIYEELQHSVHRAEILRDEVIPRFEESLVDTQRAYEKGRYPYYELRAVQAELLAAKHSLVEAGTAAHRLVITLERLTGEGVAR